MICVCSSSCECINRLFPKYENMYTGKVQETNKRHRSVDGVRISQALRSVASLSSCSPGRT